MLISSMFKLSNFWKKAIEDLWKKPSKTVASMPVARLLIAPRAWLLRQQGSGAGIVGAQAWEIPALKR